MSVGQFWLNEDELDERGTRLRDGPLDGAFAKRPNARMRKTPHAQGFRLPDEQQPWKPGMPEAECRTKFAIYRWLVADQAYGWVDFFDAKSEEQLMQALQIVAED